MTREEIAKILKDLRVSAGYSQKVAAEAVGKKQQTLASWETAQSQPDANTLFVLCDLYGASVDTAFGFSKLKNSTTTTPEELLIISKYRKLDERGKKAVCDTLEREYSYIEGHLNTQPAPEPDKPNDEPYMIYPIAARSKDDRPAMPREITPEIRERMRNAKPVTSEEDI